MNRCLRCRRRPEACGAGASVHLRNGRGGESRACRQDPAQCRQNPNTGRQTVCWDLVRGDANALLSDLKAGKLKALWMVGADLPLSEQAQFDTAPLVDGLDLFICQGGAGFTDSARAHVQLASGGLGGSRRHVYKRQKPGSARLRKSVGPQGDARSHLELISLIAKKAKLNLAPGEKWQVSARQAFLQMVAQFAAQVPAWG